MFKILITDKIAESGIDYIRSTGDAEPVERIGINEDELAAIICEYDGLIIRSGTTATAKVLESGERLRAIVRAGVGVDNIDIESATKRGVLVMNTPDANTLSAAEHTMALLLAMCRNVVPACLSLKAGEWDRKRFVGNQLNNKVLGIVGVGRIGKAVAKMARGFNMKVTGYDPLAIGLDAEETGLELKTDFEELLEESDFVSLHIPKNERTMNMIDKPQLNAMKPDARLINCARGGIVNEAALYDALRSKSIAGAAMDVFEQEPPENRDFENLDNCLVTPHLGASTEEAQTGVAMEAAKTLLDALRGSVIRNAVNAPSPAGIISPILRTYAELSRRIGMVASAIAQGRIENIQVQCRGSIARHDVEIVTTSFLTGLLQPYFETRVNMVNARILAAERGIGLDETKNTEPRNFASELGAIVTTRDGQTSITGTVLSEKIMRIIGINGFDIEMTPADTVMIVFNDDKPGVIGAVGTILGRHGINVQTMGVGQKLDEKKAVLAFSIDKNPGRDTMDTIRSLDFVNRVYLCRLD